MVGRTVIVVDDGAATGLTLQAALRGVRDRDARLLIAGLPVISAAALARLRGECDAIVALTIPEAFYAVGLFYQDFEQLDDDTVVNLLEASRVPRTTS